MIARVRPYCPAPWAVLLFLLSTIPAVSWSQWTVERVGGSFSEPVRLVAPPGDSRLFVVERAGRVRLLDRDGSERGVFLDMRSRTETSGERGLLGLAFPADYATRGRFYLSYTDLQGRSVLARYEVSADADSADAASEEVLLLLDQPFANHNGGHIEFGPDGMLYWGLGDGGGSADPGNRAQDDQTLLGKMLRLDVSGAVGYAIPPGNPFVGAGPREEIWAKGLRNPWTFSFDRQTGDLYIADVGQNRFEEIDIQPSSSSGGENYGWRLMEGDQCFEPAVGCNDGSLTLPVHVYAHGGTPFRCSISGGYVYRGTVIPDLQGEYLYSDFCSGQIFGLRWTPPATVAVRELTDILSPAGGFGSVAAFGQDGFGELYVLGYDSGALYRIVPEGGQARRRESFGAVKGAYR